jgi:ABC-2 type transport system permease protein
MNHGATWASVAAKDWREYRRDWRLALISLLVAVLAATAVVAAFVEVTAHDADRRATIARDRGTWEGQGERNPHSAAHFAFWAFRPLPPMALLDPGVLPYAGSAIWLEAHNRNPAQARPAEDLAGGLDLGRFSAAWVFQYVVPLLLFIIGAGLVAREREAGTLRLMLASGLAAGRVMPAKYLALGRIAAVLVLPLLAAALVATMLAGPVDGLALLLWLAAYLLYFAILAALAVAVSALCATAAQARLLLVGLWLVMLLIVPRLGSGLAMQAVPVPSPHAFAAGVQAQMKSGHDPFGADAKAFEAGVMARYGVTRLADLPVNIDGLRLEAAEAHGNRVFDAAWGGLAATHQAGHAALRLTALLSPLVPLQNLSMALAGSDAHVQRDFQDRAEAHRRRIITLLNDDMTRHAGKAGFDYHADAALWRQVPDFAWQPPGTAAALARSWPDAVALGLWLLAGLGLLRLAGRRLAAGLQ